MEHKTFAKACKDHFGLKPGQTLQAFALELKGLYSEAPDFWATEFARIGVELTGVRR